MRSNLSTRAIMDSLKLLDQWIKKEHYLGWDPYDGLSGILRRFENKRFLNTLILQANLYSPVNFRPLLGVKKACHNKALALLSRSYLMLFQITGDTGYKSEAEKLLKILIRNDLSGNDREFACSSYAFTYVAPNHLLRSNIPDIICATETMKSLLLAYELFNNTQYFSAAERGKRYLLNRLLVEGKDYAYFKYTPYEKGKIVFNVSALALEAISLFLKHKREGSLIEIGEKVTDFLLKFQRGDGAWPYSYFSKNKIFYWQNDYHQGFIIDGLQAFTSYLTGAISNDKVKEKIKKGILFYQNKQFDSKRRSYYRYPIKYPVDIHNQAQGIITFSKLYSSTNDLDYLNMAEKIADWTIRNMQSSDGYFFSHWYLGFVNKIPYMRWGQAWMMLALSSLLKNKIS